LLNDLSRGLIASDDADLRMRQQKKLVEIANAIYSRMLPTARRHLLSKQKNNPKRDQWHGRHRRSPPPFVVITNHQSFQSLKLQYPWTFSHSAANVLANQSPQLPV
jgi:hypothetical protein